MSIKTNVRYFISDYEDHREVNEREFIEEHGTIAYERHTVFNNGVNQICLTKSDLEGY